MTVFNLHGWNGRAENSLVKVNDISYFLYNSQQISTWSFTGNEDKVPQSFLFVISFFFSVSTPAKHTMKPSRCGCNYIIL